MTELSPNLIENIELDDAIERLEKIIDHEEAEGYSEVPQNETQSVKKKENNYVEEPILLENIKKIAKEIAEIVEQNEEIERKIEYNELKKKPKPYQKHDVTIKSLYERDQKTRERVAEKQMKKFLEERKELKEKPTISKKSKEMVATLKTKPVHERINEDLAKRFLNLEKLKQEVMEQQYYRELEQERNLWPKANCPEELGASLHSKPTGRTPDKIYEEMQSWQKKKERNIQEQQLKKLEKELEGLKFHPDINEHSVRLSAAKGNRQEPVEERLLKSHEEKLDKQRLKETVHRNKFSPFINRNSKDMAEKYKERCAKAHRKIMSIDSNAGHVEKNISKETLFSKTTTTPTKAVKQSLNDSNTVGSSEKKLLSPEVSSFYHGKRSISMKEQEIALLEEGKLPSSQSAILGRSPRGSYYDLSRRKSSSKPLSPGSRERDGSQKDSQGGSSQAESFIEFSQKETKKATGVHETVQNSFLKGGPSCNEVRYEPKMNFIFDLLSKPVKYTKPSI